MGLVPSYIRPEYFVNFFLLLQKVRIRKRKKSGVMVNSHSIPCISKGSKLTTLLYLKKGIREFN